jgi:hypothetical protein
MPKVTMETESHVTYTPRIKVQFTNGDGSTSRITWGNPDLMKGLRKMFGAGENESITSIEVTEEGITANLAMGRRTFTWKR